MLFNYQAWEREREVIVHTCSHTSMYIYMYFRPPRPLHVAARNGLTMVVQELLGKGASVLAVDENGK